MSGDKLADRIRDLHQGLDPEWHSKMNREVENEILAKSDATLMAITSG